MKMYGESSINNNIIRVVVNMYYLFLSVQPCLSKVNILNTPTTPMLSMNMTYLSAGAEHWNDSFLVQNFNATKAVTVLLSIELSWYKQRTT